MLYNVLWCTLNIKNLPQLHWAHIALLDRISIVYFHYSLFSVPCFCRRFGSIGVSESCQLSWPLVVQRRTGDGEWMRCGCAGVQQAARARRPDQSAAREVRRLTRGRRAARPARASVFRRAARRCAVLPSLLQIDKYIRVNQSYW